ncbi:ATP-binding protein [Saccharothrix sp. NPDC042600]|uniref:ATP-binding protein n=1 Tax=Saccharothrix TaxID=2071 RepID=UPI0033E66884|nr:ATP-binding protein [Saccharothrix mutabilis subsp. capreolus]
MSATEVPRSAARSQALDLAARPEMAEVRRWVRAAAPEVAGDPLEDLLLVVTELVTNAYDHSPRPRRLRLSVLPERVRVEVEDSSGDPPVVGRSRISDSRGRGLVLVAALSADWGHTAHGDGKTVWADVVHGPA